MNRENLITKYYVEDYAKGKSVTIKDPCGYLLSLPNNKDESGELFIDQCIFYALDGKIPLFTKVLWHHDGEYINFYRINYNSNKEKQTNA